MKRLQPYRLPEISVQDILFQPQDGPAERPLITDGNLFTRFVPRTDDPARVLYRRRQRLLTEHVAPHFKTEARLTGMPLDRRGQNRQFGPFVAEKIIQRPKDRNRA